MRNDQKALHDSGSGTDSDLEFELAGGFSEHMGLSKNPTIGNVHNQILPANYPE